MKLKTIKGKIKRALAVAMAVAIVATSISVNNIVVHAEGEDASQEVIVENISDESGNKPDEKKQEDVKTEEVKTEVKTAEGKTEEGKTEETKTEEVTKDDTKTESPKTEESKIEENKTENSTIEDQNGTDAKGQDEKTEVVGKDTTVSENAAEETVSANEAVPTVSENEIQPVRLTKELNGVRIVATADAGVLPENAVLEATEITTTQAIETAVEETVTATEEVEEIKSYDIKILSDGEEIQPEDGTVSITFEGIQVESDEKAAVVYTSDDASQVEKQDTEVSGDAVSFEAEHFSIYNVVIITNAKTGDKLTTFVPNEGYTQLDLQSYFNKQAITEVQVAEDSDSIIEAHLKEENSSLLQITAKGSEENKKATVTIKSKDAKKTLTLTVYVSAKPAMTSTAFAAAFSEKIASYANGYTDTFKEELKKVNNGNSSETRIDSNASEGTDKSGVDNGKRVVAVKNVMNVSAFTGYSFLYNYNKKTNDRALYYLPIDLTVLTGEDDLAINKKIDQYFLVDCYEGGSLSPVQKLMKITPIDKGGTTERYWGLVSDSDEKIKTKTVTFLNDDGAVITQVIGIANAKAPAPTDFYTSLGDYKDKATADKYSRFVGWTTDGGKTILSPEDIQNRSINEDVTYTAVYETIAHFYVRVNDAWKDLAVASGSNVGVLDDSVYEVYKDYRLNVGSHGFTRETLSNLIKAEIPATITVDNVEYNVIPTSLVKEADGWHIDCTAYGKDQYQVVYVDHKGTMISTAMVSGVEEELTKAPTNLASYSEKDGTYLYEFQNEWTREPAADITVAQPADMEPVILKPIYELTKIYANVFVLNKDVLGPVTDENRSEVVSGNQGYKKVGQVELKFDQVKDMTEDNERLLLGNDQILSADGYIESDEISKLSANGTISEAAIEKLAETYTNLNFAGYTMDWYIMKNYNETGFHIDGVPVARPVVDTPATGGGTTGGGTTTTTTTGGGGTGGGTGTTTTTTPATTTLALTNVPTEGAQNVVIPDAPVAQAATPETGAINEADTVAIPEEEVALAATPAYRNDCAIHWIILLMTFCYSVFAMVRAFARHRQIDEMLDNDDMEKVRAWEIK